MNFTLGFSYDQLAETICWKLGIIKKGEHPTPIHIKIVHDIKTIIASDNYIRCTTQKGNYSAADIWSSFFKLKDDNEKRYNAILRKISFEISAKIFSKFSISKRYEELLNIVKTRKSFTEVADKIKEVKEIQIEIAIKKKLEILNDQQFSHALLTNFPEIGKIQEMIEYLPKFTMYIWDDVVLKWINEGEGIGNTSNTHGGITKTPSKKRLLQPQLPHNSVFSQGKEKEPTELQSMGSNFGVNSDNRSNTVDQQHILQTQISEEKKPVEVASLWKYNQVPENEPDKHTEDEALIQTSPDGMPIIGARVRGKKHKHEGTNCDDWFEVVVVGKWTIIAVSDGAGSKKFSRVGAQASCERVIQFLQPKLMDFEFSKKTEWNADIFTRDEQTHNYIDPDIQFVEGILHQAMKEAYQAVEKAFDDRKNNPDYLGLLGRPLEFSDLSCTLLVALHSTVVFKGNMYHFVMGCHIGDGMIAAIDIENIVRLLAVPDAGDFSGETDFLTSAKKSERANLINKTFLYFGVMKVLMVMSDGVSDDYFPNDQRMLELYGDLVLNDIIQIEEKTEIEITAALESVPLALVDIQNMDFPALSERLKADGNTRPFIRSIIKYSEKLGLPIPAITTSPALLAAAKTGKESKRLLSEDGVNQVELRLKIWLDAYYVKGSFDDRTLVIMNNTLKNLPPTPQHTPSAPPPSFDEKLEIPPEHLHFHMGGLLR